jgi:hypothetical protein
MVTTPAPLDRRMSLMRLGPSRLHSEWRFSTTQATGDKQRQTDASC